MLPIFTFVRQGQRVWETEKGATMSEASATIHAEHHQEGFVRHYIFSLDHKMIGRQFLFASLLMLMVGGLLAMMIRWQLGYPEQPMPFSGAISEEFWDSKAWLAQVAPYGVMTSEFYNAAFTMHATIMIFFGINFVWSLFAGKPASDNPWQANTLEWSAPSPPPHGNFVATPTVYRGSYEYSHPMAEQDYLPQTLPIEVAAAGEAAH